MARGRNHGVAPGVGMPIRDHYIQAFDAIREQYGEEPSGYEISAEASLQEVIGYTGRFVIRDKEDYFRYEYYLDCLRESLIYLIFDFTNRQIFHLDIGCGPGVFSWVVHDYFSWFFDNCVTGHERNDIAHISTIGYDHAKNMIYLADLFHKYIPAKYDVKGYSDIKRLRAILKSKDLSKFNVFVTLGHVLIQNGNNPQAMCNFAQIIQRLFPCHSCVLLAVDAYGSYERCGKFRSSCNYLLKNLQKIDMNAIRPQWSKERSYMHTLLRMKR